jgi:putative transposase
VLEGTADPSIQGQTLDDCAVGTQFTAWTFTDRAKKSGLLPSMGSIGGCYYTTR